MQVLGISTDSVKSHRKFRESLKLPFGLLSDDEGKASELYGVLMKRPGGALLSGRSVFLIDSGGVVRHADPKYDLRSAEDHDALMKAVQKFRVRKPEIKGYKFGRIEVNGVVYREDVIIDGGFVRVRDKGPSRNEKKKYGHTPLTVRESIPWHCETLVVGTGMRGRLPVLDQIKEEAKRRGVKLIILETPAAVEYLNQNFRPGMNALLHVTC